MDLGVYLRENCLTQAKFGRKIGYTRNYICLIVRKKVKPGKPVMKAIEKATKGLVTFG